MPSAKPPCPPLPTCPDLAEDHLEPIRAFVHARHGMLTELANEMNRRTSTPITRQAVSRWLHPEKKKRQEPKLGTFLVMAESFKHLAQAGQPAESADA